MSSDIDSLSNNEQTSSLFPILTGIKNILYNNLYICFPTENMPLELTNVEISALQNYQQNGIRIGAVLQPENVEPCFFDKTIPRGLRKRCHPGTAVLITQLVLEVLKIPRNMRYYTAVNHTNFGYSGGIIGQIWDGVFDVSVPNIAISEQRKTYVQFSTAVNQSNYFVMSRYATMGDRSMFNSFAVLRPMIWTLICCGSFAIGAALTILKWDWKAGLGRSVTQYRFGTLRNWCLTTLDASSIYFGQGKLGF